MLVDQLSTMARTVYGEARGEPFEGKLAVAFVIRNRAARPGWWGKDVESVCRRPYQFSCWNAGDPNRPAIEAVDLPDASFAECLVACIAALREPAAPDPTQGATHYHAKGVMPVWTQGKTPCARIGGHLFYNDID